MGLESEKAKRTERGSAGRRTKERGREGEEGETHAGVPGIEEASLSICRRAPASVHINRRQRPKGKHPRCPSVNERNEEDSEGDADAGRDGRTVPG